MVTYKLCIPTREVVQIADGNLGWQEAVTQADQHRPQISSTTQVLPPPPSGDWDWGYRVLNNVSHHKPLGGDEWRANRASLLSV